MNNSSCLTSEARLPENKTNRLRWISISAGALSALLGIVVLFGWYTHKANLIQVHHSFVPMQYNTAFGFFLCGVAMMLISFQKHRPAAVFAGIAGLVGFLTLVEYIFHIKLGIDQLFMEHYITVQTSDPAGYSHHSVYRVQRKYVDIKGRRNRNYRICHETGFDK